MKLKLSSLKKTWLIDIDGVIFKHNAYLKYYKKNKNDKLLPGVKRFLKKIPSDDYIILLTSRNKKFKDYTIKQLNYYGIRFNKILFDLPVGERILINDIKPNGLKTAIAINLKRDKGPTKLHLL